GEAGVAAVAQPIAFAADVDGRGVVEQPVQEGGGEHGVGEEFVPASEALVAGEDDGACLLVALVDHLEEEGRVLLAERQVADLVQDEEFGPDQVAHEVLEAVSRPLLAGLTPSPNWSGHLGEVMLNLFEE